MAYHILHFVLLQQVDVSQALFNPKIWLFVHFQFGVRISVQMLVLSQEWRRRQILLRFKHLQILLKLVFLQCLLLNHLFS